MVTSTFSSCDSIGDILVRATPFILAGLAVAVPARAGLVNVGGEGQLIIGGVGAVGHVDGSSTAGCPAALTLVLMIARRRARRRGVGGARRRAARSSSASARRSRRCCSTTSPSTSCSS